MIIYKITNNINNKVYIGQTIETIKKRWSRHTWKCTIKRNAMAITNAIIKYGKENFIIEQIDIAKSIEELNEKEIYYIYRVLIINLTSRFYNKEFFTLEINKLVFDSSPENPFIIECTIKYASTVIYKTIMYFPERY
jgi:group I intron endonuclease